MCLAGVVFADEAEALERRMLGVLVPDSGTEERQTATPEPNVLEQLILTREDR